MRHISTKSAVKSLLVKLYFQYGYRTHIANFPKIVMYHSVGDNGNYATSRAEFRNHLEFLDQYYSFVDLPAAVKSPSEPMISLTFDDGYENFIDNALPILQEFDAPATVFLVSSSLIDNERDPVNLQPLDTMSIDDLNQLKRDPLVTIGSHTKTHRNLAELGPEEQREEIVGGKRVLEDELDIEIDRFAYPGGSYDDTSVDIARTSHDFAVTAQSSVDGGYTGYTLPRFFAFEETTFKWHLTPFCQLIQRVK